MIYFYKDNDILQRYTFNCSIDSGITRADVYKVTAVVNHTVDTSEIIVDAWTLSSRSMIFEELKNNSHVSDYRNPLLVTYNNLNATIVGYVYHIYDTTNNQPECWLPTDTSRNNAVMAYSLYLANPSDTMTSLQSFDDVTQSKVSVYPIPVNSDQRMEITSLLPSVATVQLLGINGNVALDVFIGYINAGKTNLSFDVSALSNGVYFYKVTLGNACHIVKTVIQSF